MGKGSNVGAERLDRRLSSSPWQEAVGAGTGRRTVKMDRCQWS